MLAQMVLPLPEAAVEVGETWTRKLAIPAGPDGQTRKIEQTYTYKGPDPAGPPRRSTSPPGSSPQARPQRPGHVQERRPTGRVEFDNAAGRIAWSSVDEEVESALAVQGKEIPQKVETTTDLVPLEG